MPQRVIEDDDRRDRKHNQHRPSVKEKGKVPAPRVAHAAPTRKAMVTVAAVVVASRS